MVALDLGGSGIRAAEFKVNKGTPVITKTGFVALPVDAIKDGEVKDPEAIGTALKELWSEQKFSSKQVVFGISSPNVLVRIKALDWDFEDDFRKSLKYQPGVAEGLTFDVDQANLDYHTLAEYMTPTEDGGEKKVKQILLLAAEKTLTDLFVQGIRAGGLQPVHADLSSFALIRAVNPAAHPTGEESVEVLIDMGFDVTTVILHQNGQPRFVRTVAGQGGRALTKFLSDQFGWSEEDAERTKVELGLNGNALLDGEVHPAQHAINHTVSQFITEVRNSIDYLFNSTPQTSEVSRVVLAGGGTNLKGLKERIASELRVPVDYADPSSAVVVNEGVTIPDGLTESQMAVVYGLAMGAV